jgi:hypothetical protein
MDANGSATPAPGSEHEGGLTLAVAAEQLGISKDAVRRRLRSGQLAGHQVLTQHGPAWCVHLDSPMGARHGGDAPAPGLRQAGAHGGATVVQPPDVAPLIGLVDRLQRDNQELAATAAVWQERARILSEQLALQAPQPENATVDAPGSTERPEPPMEPPGSWWRRWLWGSLRLTIATVGAGALLAWPG